MYHPKLTKYEFKRVLETLVKRKGERKKEREHQRLSRRMFFF